MSVLAILTYPDPRLKTVAPPVEDIHAPEIQKMIQDMLETLLKTEHCGGLAATQLDIQNPKRIFVFYDYDESQPEDRKPVVVVNPEIVKTEGSVFEAEGCMSVHPDYIHAKVERPAVTTLKCMNEKGDPIELVRSGYLAKLFIHEVDHLNGKLYIDHLKPLKRTMLDVKIKKVLNVIARKDEKS